MHVRPRALHLCAAVPHPALSGGHMRVAETARALHQRFEVSVVFTGTAGTTDIEKSRTFLAELGIPLILAPPRNSTRLGQRLNLIGRVLFPWAGRLFLTAPPAEVAHLFETADVIWVHRMLPLWSWRLTPAAPLVLDVDDLDENTFVFSGRLRRRLITRLYRTTRRRQLRLADVAVVNSDIDRHRLAASVPVAVMPNTYTRHGALPPSDRQPTEEATVLMVGQMGYPPNAHGAQWLIDDVWPLVLAKKPNARLRIVGRNSGTLLVPGTLTNVTLCGEVDDIQAELDRAAVSAAPIFHGSGTRIKILEAFANRIPVVSTPLGAEGLQVTDGRHLVIAQSAAAFADAIVRLLTDTTDADRIAASGWMLYEEMYSPQAFTRTLEQIVDAAIARHASR